MKLGLISSVFLFVALALAVCFGPSLESTALGVVALALAPVLFIAAFSERNGNASWFFAGLIFAAGSYAAWRAINSPVQDYGRSDGLLLVCGLASCFWAGWLVDQRALKWASIGVSILAIANVVVAIAQWRDPTFTPIFASRKTEIYPSGFYGHYNHFANFLLASGFLAIGNALDSRGKRFAQLLWWLVGGVCVAGIVLSHSRGALVGIGIGAMVLWVGWLLDLKRRKVKWFGGAVLGSVLLLPVFGFGGWALTQQLAAARGITGQAGGMMEDSGRIEFASSAIDLADRHPLIGGGSRSFSYEVFERWNPNELWVGTGDIDFVHNELLQAATDYGWLGFGLILTILLSVGLRGVLVIAVEPEEKRNGEATGLVIGAMAGVAAMLAQSMFSFVFHMAPDVLLLGLLLGMIISQPWPFKKSSQQLAIWRRPASWVAVIGAIGLSMIGWRDAAAWWMVARPRSEGVSLLPETRYDAYQRALEVRSDFRLEQTSAELAARMAREEGSRQSAEWLSRAIEHLERTLQRHPFNYSAKVDLARQFDQASQFKKAEEQYLQLIPLMDIREIYYRVRFSYGNHAFRTADALFKARRPEEALAWAQEAQRQMRISYKLCYIHPGTPEEQEMKRVDEFIRWMKEAKVIPAVDGVPMVPDPKF